MKETIIKRQGKYIIDINFISFKGENQIVAYSPALEISSYGDTEQDAQKALEENIHIFLDYTLKKNSLIEDLLNLGWTIKKKPDIVFIAPAYNLEEIAKDIAADKYELFERQIAIPA